MTTTLDLTSTTPITQDHLDITRIILKNDLYLLPLHTIVESSDGSKGVCTCHKGSKCSSPGKHPYFRYNWKVIATNSEEKISTWLTDYKDKINFAVATGRKSKITNKYLVVIDVDKFDHPIIDKLDHTFYYKTGSGGYHFWFWSDMPVKNSVSGLAPKVDIRGKDGYVVVPPSKHKSGESYVMSSSLVSKEIADIPQFVIDFIRFSKPKQATASKKVLSTKPKPCVSWSGLTVRQIRTLLENDSQSKIPEGSRNSIIHRLLSSDRTQGLNKDDLMSRAMSYKMCCAKSQDISKQELVKLVDSVMSYAPYNTKHEDVNLGFFEWKETRKQGLSDLEKENMLTLDNNFFKSLKQSNDRVPLSIVTNERNNMFSSKGIKSYSKYRPQLLAKKLESMGFSRYRTNKGNLWNIDLSGLHTADSVIE